MRLRLSIYAALVGSTLAWTNPLLTKNTAEIVRRATTRHATNAAMVNVNDDAVASLFNVNDGMRDMLESAQLSSSVCLEEMTKIFLDRDAHPPGSLSWDVLDAAFPVLHAWAKTNTEVGAQTAENILERLQLEETPRMQLVTPKHYGVVVDAWAKSNHPQSAQRAESILNQMKPPNRVAYNAVMSAWARQGNVEEALRLLQEIPSCTTQDYNTLLAAHAKCGNAREAESLLSDMVSSEHNAVPDIVSYNCVLDALAKSRDEGAAERALAILQSLPKADARSYSCVASAFVKKGNVDQVQSLLAEAQDRGIDIDAYLHNTLLEVFAMRGEATRAQQYLDEMEQEGLANSVSYNSVIKAWKRSGASDAAQQAETILDRMVAQQLDDVFTYTSVIDCFAKSKQEGSAKKAELLLERMIDQSKEGRMGVRPNTITINCVLDALAKSGAASRAEKLLTRMEQRSESYLDQVRLNTISYTSVIDAYAKSGEKGAAERAEEIFQRMEAAYKQGNDAAKPNDRSFNTVINAWVQSGEPGSAARAEAILRKMEQSYTRHEDIRPNVVSYSIVMNGWSKSGSPKALERTADVFQRMCEMYRSGNKDAQPNFVSFVTLIDAIVKSGERGAAQRAEDVLREMYMQYEDGNANVKPNARLITSVMECWARSGARNAGEKAEALLDWTISAYADEDDASYKPNEIAFNAAINAWSKSRVFGKGYRAKTVLQKMIEMYEADTSRAKPNTFVYTAVLNSCAYAIGDEAEKADAMQIATTTFDELCNSRYGKPNHVTYDAYLTACRNLLPVGGTRAASMTRVFQKCCEDGQVNDLIIRRLESALTKEQLRELYQSVGLDGGQDMELSQLPAEWKQNVQERKSTGKRGHRRR